MRLPAFIFLCSVAAAAAETYAGAAACAECHPEEGGRPSPLLADLTPHAPRRRAPDFEFRFALDPRGLLVRVAAPGRATVLPIEWAFGAGDQAVTFVSRLDAGSYLEHYFSFYSKTGKMGVTPGQEAIPAQRLIDAAGRGTRWSRTYLRSSPRSRSCRNLGSARIGDDSGDERREKADRPAHNAQNAFADP